MSYARMIAAFARAQRILENAREEFEAAALTLPPNAQMAEVPLTVAEMAAIHGLTDRQIRNLAKAGAGFKPTTGPYKGQWQIYPSKIIRRSAA